MKQLTPHNQLTIPQALRRAQVLEDTPAKIPSLEKFYLMEI